MFVILKVLTVFFFVAGIGMFYWALRTLRSVNSIVTERIVHQAIPRTESTSTEKDSTDQASATTQPKVIEPFEAPTKKEWERIGPGVQKLVENLSPERLKYLVTMGSS